MNTPVKYPLTIYYDASCPLCANEMQALAAAGRDGRLRLIDCSAPEFDDRRIGVPRAELMRLIHARDARGRWFRGVDVFVLAYRAAGIEAAARLFSHPRWRGLWDRVYPWLARHRMQLSRLGLARAYGPGCRGSLGVRQRIGTGPRTDKFGTSAAFNGLTEFGRRSQRLTACFGHIAPRAIIMSMQAESLEILEKADVSPGQARAIVRAIGVEIAGAKDTLATKHDIVVLHQEISEVRTEFKQEMSELRGELKAEIHASASSIARQMYASLLGRMAVLLGIAYFFVSQIV